MIESHQLLYDQATSSLGVPASQESINGDQKRLMVLVKLQKNGRRKYCINTDVYEQSLGDLILSLGKAGLTVHSWPCYTSAISKSTFFMSMKNAPKYPRPQLSFESFSTIHAYSLKTHILGYVLVPGLTSNLYTIIVLSKISVFASLHMKQQTAVFTLDARPNCMYFKKNRIGPMIGEGRILGRCPKVRTGRLDLSV